MSELPIRTLSQLQHSKHLNQLEIREGSLLNRVDVETLVKNCDAVCWVFGLRPSFTDVQMPHG
ncbi:MAG: hypothetical protein ACUVRV_03530 [Cyanobacteriota bacterium]